MKTPDNVWLCGGKTGQAANTWQLLCDHRRHSVSASRVFSLKVSRVFKLYTYPNSLLAAFFFLSLFQPPPKDN